MHTSKFCKIFVTVKVTNTYVNKDIFTIQILYIMPFAMSTFSEQKSYIPTQKVFVLLSGIDSVYAVR